METGKTLLVFSGLIEAGMSYVVLIEPVLMIVVVMITMHYNLAGHNARLATRGMVSMALVKGIHNQSHTRDNHMSESRSGAFS